MISLLANTTTKILTKTGRERIIQVSSDSTTITRISYSPKSLDSSTGGFGITSSNGAFYVVVPAEIEIYAVSTGTPNISTIECAFRPVNAVRLDTT